MFKVGDRVVYLTGSSRPRGQRATVLAVWKDIGGIICKWDDPPVEGPDHLPWRAASFRLDVPDSPLEVQIKDYIRSELPNGL